MEDGDWVLVQEPQEKKDILSPTLIESRSSRPLKVTFKEPAKHWTDALPIGNGRLGAMVWGGLASEIIQLNGQNNFLFAKFQYLEELFDNFNQVVEYGIRIMMQRTPSGPGPLATTLTLMLRRH